jgi:hypothetical protein
MKKTKRYVPKTKKAFAGMIAKAAMAAKGGQMKKGGVIYQTGGKVKDVEMAKKGMRKMGSPYNSPSDRIYDSKEAAEKAGDLFSKTGGAGEPGRVFRYYDENGNVQSTAKYITNASFNQKVEKSENKQNQESSRDDSTNTESDNIMYEENMENGGFARTVNKLKTRFDRFRQKRKERPMSETRFYKPNVAKGGGSGYKAMTEYGNLGRGISALMTKKSKNPETFTKEDEAELKRMQRIQAATKPGSKESVRDIYLEETKAKQDKSKMEYDEKMKKFKEEDESAKKKRKEGSEKVKQTLTPGRKFVTGGINNNEEDNDEEGKNPTQESSGNYRGGSNIPQVVRDKDIVRNRGKKQNNESSNTDEVTTSGDNNKMTSADRVERRSNRKDYRRAMRKYRQEMRQYNRTMRRKAREERRENRGMTYTQGRRISPRRWFKNLRDKLGARYLHEGRAKGYRDFNTSRTTRPEKPVKNFKDGGKVNKYPGGGTNFMKRPYKDGGKVSKYPGGGTNFMKRPYKDGGTPMAREMSDGMKEHLKKMEERDAKFKKIKQPAKGGAKKLTKSQIAKILAKKGGKALLKSMGYVGIALTARDVAKEVAPATKPALKKRAKKGNYNIGRKI